MTPGGIYTDPDGNVVHAPNVNVLIPEKHLVKADRACWQQLMHRMTLAGANPKFWWMQAEDPATWSVRVRGYLPTDVVTALMALAQGHPLAPILARSTEEV